MFIELLKQWQDDFLKNKRIGLSPSQTAVLLEFAIWLDARSPTLREPVAPIPAAHEHTPKMLGGILYCKECGEQLD